MEGGPTGRGGPPSIGGGIPVTRVSYIGRGGWVDLDMEGSPPGVHTLHGGCASMHGVQRPISPQVLTKLSSPPSLPPFALLLSSLV